MRALRGLAAASLLTLVGGVAIAVHPATASAAPTLGTATLTLDPSSGNPGTTITATFQVNERLAPDGNCRLRVTYRWDGQAFGQDSSSSCTSRVRFRAPRNVREGSVHNVSAVDSTTHLFAFATFTIVGADPTTAGPTPTRTRTGAPSPSDTPAAVDPPPATDLGPTLDTSVEAAHGETVPQVKPSSSLTAWALMFGGALVLGGVTIFILVVLRMRRGNGDDGDEDFGGYEPAPVAPRAPLNEYPTQQFYPPRPELPD